MTDLIEFYHNPMSRGRIAHWMLEEIGAPYHINLLRLDKGEHKAKAYLDINPMGKIPAIIHRGRVITEAAAICAYLADAFFDRGLAPALDDPDRGPYLRWLFFAAGCLEPAVIDHTLSRPKVERAGTIGYGTYEDTLAALEKAVTPGPFILGDKFSAADVYVASQIGWGMMTKGIEARPAFQKYMAGVADRPAFHRANEQDERLVAQLKAEG